MSRIGRNDPCPCGSGLKHKKCCLKEQRANVLSLDASRLRKIEERLAGQILDYMKALYGEQSVWMAQYEYFCWPDDIPVHDEIHHEMVQAFTPWIIYNWKPELEEFLHELDGELDEEDLPPMENPAQGFLRDKGSRLRAEERRFIELSCAAQFSFHKVLDVRPEQGMDIEDMITGERTFVQDISASRMAFDGMIMFARVLKASEDVAILAGTGMTALPPVFTDEIIDLRNHIRKGMEALKRESEAGRLKVTLSEIDVRHDYDLEIRACYHRLAERIRNPAPLIMQNTDGEDIVPLQLVYEFSCSPQEAFDKLATLCNGESAERVLHSANPGFDSSGELETAEFPWLVKRSANSMLENTVNGRLSINGQTLTIEVNSQERSEAVQRKIKRRLGRSASLRYIEELQSAHPGVPAQPELSDAEQQELMNSPEIRQQIEAMSQRHWQQWLDESLPALHGQAPREAARTPEGRELLEALFDEYAYRDEQLSQEGPMASFKAPIGTLRKELGMA
ncbi:YecA family protein [Granulosicoccus sp. 3-233]|uniref:YecA family protein n=1 Tax=Granulosicoccus sp. 3-233 TaxID=3417969 RepID=UPI003D3458EB